MADETDAGGLVYSLKLKLSDDAKRTVSVLQGLLGSGGPGGGGAGLKGIAGSFGARLSGGLEQTARIISSTGMQRLLSTVSRSAAVISSIIGFMVGTFGGGQGMAATRGVIGQLSDAVDDILFKKAWPEIQSNFIVPLTQQVKNLQADSTVFSKLMMLGLAPDYLMLRGKLFALGGDEANKTVNDYLASINSGIQNLVDLVGSSFVGAVQSAFLPPNIASKPLFPTPVTSAATGFEGVVSRPTRFVVGDAGPEYVSATPLNKMRGGGGGGGGGYAPSLQQDFGAQLRYMREAEWSRKPTTEILPNLWQARSLWIGR